MRKLLYIAILLSLFFAPLEKADVAKLLPMEAVAMYMEAGQVVLETDTQNIGKGISVDQALQNLKDSTPAVVYLDTAKYLLLSDDAISYAEDLRRHLRPSVEVARWNAKGKVKDAAKYLSVHGETVQLKHWKAEDYLP